MKYKYIHIFYFSSIQFDESVVKTLNDKGSGFYPEEHLFISCSKEEYGVLKRYGNVILDEEKAILINKYANEADWIIAHGLPFVNILCKVKRKYLKKIIWRTWGSDAGYVFKEGDIFRNIIKRLLNFYYGRFVHRISVVGVANIVDSINFQKLYGDFKFFTIPYLTNEYDIAERVKQESKMINNGCLNILLGHSGFQNDNHLEIISLLKRFANQDIKVYLVLSYGDPQYIKKVKHFAKECLKKKVVFVEEQMSYEYYANLMNSMDIAILDGKKSYALGNIQLLLHLGKQLYVNECGVIKQGLDMEGIPYRTTAELKNIEYDELKQVSIYELDGKTSMTLHDYHSNCGYWHALFDYLKGM